MEIRARYVAVGLFTLFVVMAGFGYVFWKARASLDKQWALYDIYFQAPVSGLTLNGEVQFNGIKVGQISEIDVVPDDPSRVRVRVEIGQDTPVHMDAVAKVEPKGITGVSYVQILGGKAGGKLLRPESPGQVPVIPSMRSELAELFASAPEVMNRAILLLNSLNELLNTDNRKALAEIIGNVRDVTRTVAEQRQTIGKSIADAGTAANNLAEASGRLRDMAGRIEGILDRAQSTFDKADTAMQAAKGTFSRAETFIDQDLSQAARSFRSLADNLDQAVKDSSPGVATFSNEGLGNLNRLLREASVLVGALERLAWRLESNPQAIIFGDRMPEEPIK